VFRGEIVYVPYVRPGFPLARLVGGMVDRLPRSAVGLAPAHHGLVVWGEDARECYARRAGVVSRIDEYFETRRRGRAVLGATPRPIPDAEVRRRCAERVLPVARGMLGSQPEGRVILRFAVGEDIRATLAAERRPGWVPRAT